MNWKDFWFEFKNYATRYGRVIVSIGGVILFLSFLIWSGWKGVIAFVSGMLIMTILILSKNPMLMGLVNMFTASDYIDKFFEGYDEKLYDEKGDKQSGKTEKRVEPDAGQGEDETSQGSGTDKRA